MKGNVLSRKPLAVYLMSALLIAATFSFAIQLHQILAAQPAVVTALPTTASNDYGNFSEMQNTVANMLVQAFNMVRSWILPAAALACAVSFVLARLPGMDQRTVSAANGTFWGCIFAVVLCYAVPAILSIAKTLGNNISNGANLLG